MNKVIFTLIALLTVLGGCTGTMEKLPGSLEKSKYGPSNAKQQPGIISYWEAHGSTARENTYKKMYEACNGSYKILSEERGGSGSSSAIAVPLYGGGSIATASNSRKIYIRFICS